MSVLIFFSVSFFPSGHFPQVFRGRGLHRTPLPLLISPPSLCCLVQILMLSATQRLQLFLLPFSSLHHLTPLLLLSPPLLLLLRLALFNQVYRCFTQTDSSLCLFQTASFSVFFLLVFLFQAQRFVSLRWTRKWLNVLRANTKVLLGAARQKPTEDYPKSPSDQLWGPRRSSQRAKLDQRRSGESAASLWLMTSKPRDSRQIDKLQTEKLELE